eukprot:1185177-Prorocentrum_minimum.AAC.5
MATSTFMGQALTSKVVARGESTRQVTVCARAPVRKAAPKKGTKAAPKSVPKSGKSVKGWGGGDAVYALDKWYGPDRKLYLPGGLLAPEDVPTYLNGELAGDYGYDPLGLGKNAAQLATYRKNELLHGRWAMIASVGCIVPEACNAFAPGTVNGAVWWQTGAAMLDGGLLNFFGVTVPFPLIIVVALNVVLLGLIEGYRSANKGPGGISFPFVEVEDLDELYPGGQFDPLGLADDPDAFAELRVKEIKNGRLAMIAMLGFAAQAKVTQEGAYANWAKHVADPFGYNLLTVVGNAERVPTL